jgi:hypothetical protein
VPLATRRLCLKSLREPAMRRTAGSLGAGRFDATVKRYGQDCSEWESWETLFQKAADFLTAVGLEKAISVSHSHEGMFGVVVVWYWTDEPPTKPSA